MATIGVFPGFDPSRGSFTALVERIQYYLAANGMAEGKHAAVLLSEIGEEIYSLLRKLRHPACPRTRRLMKLSGPLRLILSPSPW